MIGFVLGHGLVAAGAAVALLGALALLQWFRERDQRDKRCPRCGDATQTGNYNTGSPYCLDAFHATEAKP